MNLFSTANNLIDLFSKSSEQDLTAVSQKAGVPAKDAASVLALGLPLLMGAINKNTQTDEGLASFNQALKDHADDPQFDNLAGYAQDIDTQEGDKVLNHLLPNNKGTIIDQIANTLGLSPQAVKNVLIIAAPLLIKYFAQNKKNQGLNREQVRQQTRQEQDNLARQANDNGGLLGGLVGSVLGGALGNTSNNNNGGLLGSVIEGALGGNKSNQTNQQQDGGLLGSLLDLLN